MLVHLALQVLPDLLVSVVLEDRMALVERLVPRVIKANLVFQVVWEIVVIAVTQVPVVPLVPLAHKVLVVLMALKVNPGKTAFN